MASLPGLNKQGSLLAIRGVGESERSQYGIIGLQGDSIVLDHVIAPYLEAERKSEDQPLSSVLITPLNYKFRYAGAVETGDRAAYIFRITPRKGRGHCERWRLERFRLPLVERHKRDQRLGRRRPPLVRL